MKYAVLFSAFFLASSSLFSQISDLEKSIRDDSSIPHAESDSKVPSKWQCHGMFALNASQTQFFNWAAGGENSVGGNALANVSLDYVSYRQSWNTTLDLGYGLLQQGKGSVIKTDDRIDFATKYGQRANKHWYYAAMLQFKTQFTDGYNYPNDSDVISTFMAPAYLIGAIGMDYKPHKSFSAFISPITAKWTFVLDDDLSNMGAFGVDSGKHVYYQYGGYMRFVYSDQFAKNTIGLTSKLDLFSNYVDKAKNIDVTWEVLMTFKINKFLQASINTQLVYDDDIKTITTDAEGNKITKGPRIQFKEVVGIGLAYKF